MTTCEKQFVQLLRTVISKEELPADIDWARVWNLARRHHGRLQRMIPQCQEE